MWENMDRTEDLSWVVEGMKNYSLIWVTDGSYDRIRAPTVSGAGWVIYCTKSKRMLKAYFHEVSKGANSYRAEQLGLCAIHNFMSALEEFYQVGTWHSKICCDNQSALNSAKF